MKKNEKLVQILMKLFKIVPLLNNRRMPRLSLEQHEQAIGRLNGGQRPSLVAQVLTVMYGLSNVYGNALTLQTNH